MSDAVEPTAPAAAASAPVLPINIQEIMEYLPHRYPFLMLDRVIAFEPRKRIVCIKNVTINEPFFQGHFPGAPIMPGVLILEAMAQAGALMIMKEFPNHDEKLIFFTGVEGAKFRHPVTPGDQLRLDVEVLKFRLNAGRMQGQAFVGDKLACEATLSCAIVDRKR